MTRRLILVGLVASTLFLTSVVSRAADPAADLAGLWHARRSFGPEVRGPLLLSHREDLWHLEIAGYEAEGRARGDRLQLELPGDRGALRLSLGADGEPRGGHWVQRRMVMHGLRFASPLSWTRVGQELWRAEVVPLEDGFTFYLPAAVREDGSLGVFLRNPERNLGVFWNLDRLERSAESVRLVGRFFRNTEEEVLLEGRYDPEWDRLSIRMPNRGGTYDFERSDDDALAFYARGRTPAAYRYTPPPDLADGWKVGTLVDAGISLEPLREMIRREIDPPVHSVHALDVHGLLIARHGRLVFEEYFHGFHRDRPHDTRSASKGLTAILVGAAIEHGAPLDASTPVLEALGASDPSGQEDPRKRRITVEHLLTMTSGLDCDDRDSASPGNEDVMQSQEEEPDWYRFTLALDTIREPGELAVYCSINPNLLGAVLATATGETLEELFQRWIAAPLDLGSYHLPLQPTGEPYMGGGIHWLPRDFMKLGQLMLDGGTWNGRRVVSREWAERSISPLVELRDRRYGYLWWVVNYPHAGGTVRAFFAGGNGGQVVIGVPELDLLITAYAGNYSDPVLYRIQDVLVPEYILPAVAASD